jgi:hypothetical protein
MAKSRTYPPANRTAQWWETKYTRARMARITKLLLHTTETSSWPAYDAGAKAPTVTYNPWMPAGSRWRQHNYLDTSARALQDPSSTAVRENRDDVVQVEIIAYCNPSSYAKYGHGVNALPDHFYEDMGAFVAFLHLEWGLPLTRAAKWATFPPPDSIRMSGPAYDAFQGLCGHQHASGNTHGDPGLTNAQVDRILAVAGRIVAAATKGNTPVPPSKPSPTEDPIMSISDADAQKIADRVLNTPLRADGLTLKAAAINADWLAVNHAVGKKFELIHTTLAPGGDINNQLDRIEADTDAPKA